MRRSLLLLVVVGGALGCASAWGSGTPAPCGPSRAHTLASSRVARVYAWHGSVYGCSVTGGRRYRLGSTDRSMHEDRVGVVAVAGEVAAYGLTSFGVDTITATVVVRRLRDGSTLGSFAALQGVHAAEMTEAVDDVVVKRDGSLAWIADGGSITAAERTTEVLKAVRGRGSVLDSTAAGVIDVHSLRLHGSRLTWKRAGRVRSATLR